MNRVMTKETLECCDDLSFICACAAIQKVQRCETLSEAAFRPLVPYFVYVNSEGSGEAARIRRLA